MEKWGFDGLDLDYEHPHAAEKAGFANWVKGIRKAFGSKYEASYLGIILRSKRKSFSVENSSFYIIVMH